MQDQAIATCNWILKQEIGAEEDGYVSEELAELYFG
jgi:hypothetical protein